MYFFDGRPVLRLCRRKICAAFFFSSLVFVRVYTPRTNTLQEVRSIFSDFGKTDSGSGVLCVVHRPSQNV